MPELSTFIWLNHPADEVVAHYVNIFGALANVSPGSSNFTASISIAGAPLQFFDGGDYYAPTPAISLFFNCSGQDDVDTYWTRLTDGGTEGRCGWLVDRFGVSWQIIPGRLGQLLGDPDPERAGRVHAAMMTMAKLDIAALEVAAH